MTIIVKTNDPSELLKLIRNAIDDKKVETWLYDSDGDFSHTPAQWKYKAWLRPKIYAGELRLGIIKQKDVDLSTLYYAVYHGRFIEMLLTHFDKKFSSTLATAQKTEPDNF